MLTLEQQYTQQMQIWDRFDNFGYFVKHQSDAFSSIPVQPIPEVLDDELCWFRMKLFSFSVEE